MRVLREGTSGWWCMPDNVNSPAPDPLCGDANALEWFTALMERQEPTYGKVGALYGLLGAQIASNTDPYATVPPEGSDWITVPPFQGIVNDQEHIAGMVGTPTPDTTSKIAWPKGFGGQCLRRTARKRQVGLRITRPSPACPTIRSQCGLRPPGTTSGCCLEDNRILLAKSEGVLVRPPHGRLHILALAWG